MSRDSETRLPSVTLFNLQILELGPIVYPRRHSRGSISLVGLQLIESHDRASPDHVSLSSRGCIVNPCLNVSILPGPYSCQYRLSPDGCSTGSDNKDRCAVPSNSNKGLSIFFKPLKLASLPVPHRRPCTPFNTRLELIK